MIRSSLISLFCIPCFDIASCMNVHHHEQPTGLRAGGRSFLESQKADIQAALIAVLGGGHDIHHGRLEEIRQAILSTWRSLPTNQHDRVDKRSLRYGVHRYFMQHHSLSIVGLEPSHISSQHDEVLLLSQNLPAYVKTEMEGKAAQSGFSLDDAVVMIATIERLIADTDHHLLEAALKKMGKRFSQTFSFRTAHEILEAYMIRWLLGDDPESVTELEENRSALEESIELWPEISTFLSGQLKKFQYDRVGIGAKVPHHHWSAFKPQFSVSDVDSAVDSVTLTFGKFWTTECQRVKQLLVGMDRTNAGRVSLADFYGAAMNGEWRFSESKDYLRQMGALDETSAWQGAKIIITNYMQAASNCIVAASHYRVCCTNECEVILSELESAIGGPLATREKILQVLAEHESADDAVRLSPSLEGQLGGIARNSPGGLVPLHGRLFAQWLHYAFPHECPFPHKSGETSALSPLEYGDAHLASESDMEAIAKSTAAPLANSTEEETEWMSQWSHEEELLSESTRLHAPWERPRISGSVILCIVVLAIVVATVRARGSKASRDVLPTSTCKIHCC